MIECGRLWAQRNKLLDVLRADPEGVPLSLLRGVAGEQGAETHSVLRKLCKMGQVKVFHGEKGRSEYVMSGDPWYQEPKQRVMRRAVLDVLMGHMAGYSRCELARLLVRRDKECDETYTRRLMARMLNEGVVVLANGTEVVMGELVDTDGSSRRPEGAATMSEYAWEEPATVFRLSSGRWLKDNNK